MSDEEEVDWENYESGPFCRHWGNPADCDIYCATCGERCGRHDDDGCEWTEPADTDTLKSRAEEAFVK